MDGNGIEASLRSETRIIMIGKSGVGKSASGNTILGAKVFPSELSFNPVTKKCTRRTAVVAGRRVRVVDTPDFFCAANAEDLRAENKRSVALSSPGVHAFLVVLSLATFTAQDSEFVSMFERNFGEEALRFTIVLFTHGDKIHSVTIETLIRQSFSLLNFINRCSGGYHVLNNKEPTNRDQVTGLMEKIERMVSNSGSGHYTIKMLEEIKIRAKTHIEHEERKHQRTLESIKKGTDEQMKKEMSEKPMKAKAEDSKRREGIEGGIEEGQEEVTAGVSHREHGDYMNYIKVLERAILHLRPKYAYVTSVFIFFVMGFINARNKGSEHVKTFTQGCLVGVSAEVLGAVSALMILRAESRKCLGPSLRGPNTLRRSMCGFIVGAMTSYWVGGQSSVGLIFNIKMLMPNSGNVLLGLGGLAGAFGAILMSNRF